MSVKSVIFLLSCIILIIFLIVLVTPGFNNIKRFIELEIVGKLNVPGFNPQIIAVYLENNYCDEPGGADPPSVDPAEDNYRSIRFNATVYDINGDCNGGVTFYICSNESAVPPTYCNENYRVDSPISATLDAQYGGANNNIYCNYSGTYSLPYFRRCGNWYINVTASDASGLSNSTVRWWKDNLLGAIWYPYANGNIGGVVYMGDVALEQWNPGRGENTTKNVGNINISSLMWNATNFTRQNPPPIAVIPIIPMDGNTTFAIDDDHDRMNGTGYINETPSEQIQFPSYGMNRCDDWDCTSTRAKYNLSWHIYVPSVPSGVYENVIQYNYTAMGGVCD